MLTNHRQLTLLTLIMTSLGGIPLVSAHPGHAESVALSQTGISHYLTAPMHAAPLAVIGMLMVRWFFSNVLRKNK